MTLPIVEPARTRVSSPPVLRYLYLASAGLAVALQISYPLVHGAVRDRITVAVVLAFTAAVTGHAMATLGVARGAVVVGAAGSIGLLAELIGVHSGLPFGSYRYADTLGPNVGGVPVVVGLAWVMMAWPATLAARRIVPASVGARLAVATWALASWDLFLDPQMVANGHWTWRDPVPHLPGVPTVPLSNLLGWVVVSALVAAVVGRLTGRRPVRPDGPMLALYLWTYFSSILALAVWLDLTAAAAWGALGMGLVALPLMARLAAAR